jgi:non-heme chloroperoxidase
MTPSTSGTLPAVPHDSSGPRAVELVQNGTLKTYPGFPHGMLTTHADVLNPDLLAPTS